MIEDLSDRKMLCYQCAGLLGLLEGGNRDCGAYSAGRGRGGLRYTWLGSYKLRDFHLIIIEITVNINLLFP